MDDTDLADVTTPPLTSVSLGAAERGRVAAQLLLERLERPDLEARRVTVQPSLAIRGSSLVPETRARGAAGDRADGHHGRDRTPVAG